MELQDHIVEGRIIDFKRDIIKHDEYEQILQKHFIDRNCCFFSEFMGDVDLEYLFRGDVASVCDVSINDVVIVGSAKVGFSVKDINLIKFDQRKDKYNRVKKSDIDVAIVNRNYFDSISEFVFNVSCHFDPKWMRENWVVNKYNPRSEICLFDKYARYHARGWIRPDLLPSMVLDNLDVLLMAKKWRHKLDNRKIAFGIYSSWNFFKVYHLDHFKNLKSGIQLGVVK